MLIYVYLLHQFITNAFKCLGVTYILSMYMQTNVYIHSIIGLIKENLKCICLSFSHLNQFNNFCCFVLYFKTTKKNNTDFPGESSCYRNHIPGFTADIAKVMPSTSTPCRKNCAQIQICCHLLLPRGWKPQPAHSWAICSFPVATPVLGYETQTRVTLAPTLCSGPKSRRWQQGTGVHTLSLRGTLWKWQNQEQVRHKMYVYLSI